MPGILGIKIAGLIFGVRNKRNFGQKVNLRNYCITITDKNFNGKKYQEFWAESKSQEFLALK